MTTLEDLYGYYCRRCECKPNSTLSAILKEAYEAAEKAIPSADGEGVKAAHARNHNPHLTEIDLSNNYVGPKGLEPVLLLVKNLYSITTLRLCHNMLQHDAIVLLTQHLGEDKHPSLCTIDLRSNLLHNGSVPQLLFLIAANPKITEVLLEGNEGISDIERARVQNQVDLNRQKQDEDSAIAAEEDEIAAKTRGSRPKYLAHKGKVHGSLTTETSGGHFHYATWRKNPQYTLRISHTTNVALTLLIDEPIQSTRQFGFAVVQGNSILRVIDVRTKEDNSRPAQSNLIIAESSFHERRSHLELVLDACVGDADRPYTIIVYSFAPGKASSFTLSCEITDDALADRERAFVQLEPLNTEYDWSQVTEVGHWGPGVNADQHAQQQTIMGPTSCASWRENEAFRVQIKDEHPTNASSVPLAAAIDAVSVQLAEANKALPKKKQVLNKSLATSAVREAEALSVAIRKSTGQMTAAAAAGDKYIDAPYSPSDAPQPLRLEKTLRAGLATVFIVLTKNNDSDANDDNEIGFYVVSPDRNGRLPMRHVGDSHLPVALQQTRTGLPTSPQEPAMSTDGALLAFCPHARKTTVSLTVEVPIHSLDFFVIPTTSRSLSSTASNPTPFTIQFFSTTAISVERYTHNTNGNWRGQWSLYQAPLIHFDATTSGGCKQDNGSSWTYNPAIEFFNDGRGGLQTTDAVDVDQTGRDGIDLVVSVESAATSFVNSSKVSEPVEVAVMLVALRRTNNNLTGDLADTVAAEERTGHRTAKSLQHQLVVLAHSGFSTGRGAGKSTTATANGGILSAADLAAVNTYPTVIATPHSPPLPSLSSTRGVHEATFSVTNLPVGRYFIVPCTRLAGQVGPSVGAIVRCYSSGSGVRFSPEVKSQAAHLHEKHDAFKKSIGLADQEENKGSEPTKKGQLWARFATTSTIRPLGDYARDQQLLDFTEETNLRKAGAQGGLGTFSSTSQLKQSGAATTQTQQKTNFVGVNVKDLLRSGKQHMDKDFPPSDSSLWMDAVNAYPSAPPIVGWLRVPEIAKKQQERFMLNVVLPELNNETGASKSVSMNKNTLKDLEMLMLKRRSVLGNINGLSVGGSSSEGVGEPWPTTEFSQSVMRDVGKTSDEVIVASLPQPGEAASGMAAFIASAAYSTYQRRMLPANYSGCTYDHTNLGSEWYLSALACIVTRPTTFASRVIGGYNSEGGVAQFKFFINGRWVTVVIDDHLPVDATGEVCMTSSITDGDFLAPLIEKAYAKAHRCYAALGADRGAVKKAILGILPPQEVDGATATTGSGPMAPRPPTGSLVLADQSATLNNNTAGANFRRTVLARGGSGATARAGRLTDAMVLTTDASSATTSSQRVPTAPVLDNDSAAYGIDIESAHDRSKLRGGRPSNKKHASQMQPQAPATYVGSGVLNNIRYGEPPIVLLHQALTDFTGGIVRVFDITTTVASSQVSGAAPVGATTTSGAEILNTDTKSGATLRSPAHLGNNTTDSSAYFSGGMLPPHIATTISDSLYLNEDSVMNRKELAWQKILECVFDPERIIAGAAMVGAQGWEQRKHCGLQFNALYPIIDAREVDGKRLVKIFNNWGAANVVVAAKGAGADREHSHNSLWWKGKYGWSSNLDEEQQSAAGVVGEAAEGWTPRLKAAVGYDISHSKTSFWMSIAEVVYFFSHLFEVTYDASRVAAVGGTSITSKGVTFENLADSRNNAQTDDSSANSEGATWVEGGYGPEHIGGSLRSASWVNNHQYALNIHGDSAVAADSAKGQDDCVEVTIGVHQSNQRNHMTRSRDAKYTYASKPVGLCIIKTKDSNRRLAAVGPEDRVTTLYPAAVRDRYYTFKVPKAVVSHDKQQPSSYILMPFVSVAGANDDEVRWASSYSLAAEKTDEISNPFSVKRATQFYLSVSSPDTACGIAKISEDTRTVVEGQWEKGSAGGPPALGTWRTNPQYLLYPSTSGEVTVTLRQRNAIDSTAAHIGFVVVDGSASHLTRLLHLEGHLYNTNDDMLVIPNTKLLDVPHANDHAVSGTVTLLGMQERRGRPYHIVPSCSEAGLEIGFSIEVTAANPIKLTPVPAQRDWKSVSISESFKLSSGNTGGSVRYSTWRNNPQYVIKFPFEQTSRLLVSITNKNPNDSERIGCVLFSSDKHKGSRDPNSDGRKLLISNSASQPVMSALIEDTTLGKVNTNYQQTEGPYEAALLGPSFDNYKLVDPSSELPTLEATRTQQRRLDVLVDTGAYAHHSEVFYDLKVSSADEGIILMPYTATPLTELDVEITILSLAPIEVKPVTEHIVNAVEGDWEPGTTAGGARAKSNTWINNPFYSLNLISMRPTRLVIVMLVYAKGPEKPLMRKIGGTKVVVPPTTATVPPLSTLLSLTTASEVGSVTTQQKRMPMAVLANSASEVGPLAPTAREAMREKNDLLHNSHKSVAARCTFGFDIVRGDAINTPVMSSRHTAEGETSLVVEGLLPCGATQLPYFIVPHMKDQGVEGHFKIIVYSDLPIQLSEYKKPKRFW